MTLERTAAEVLAEKLGEFWHHALGPVSVDERLKYVAARLAGDPAITVSTTMSVERFVVERHYVSDRGCRSAEHVHYLLTSDSYFIERDDHRIIVRPYSEAPND
jgi:hypothetical protein